MGIAPLASYARDLRRDWEEFLSGSPVNGVRAPVADSWRRSLDAGVDPSAGRVAPVAVDRAAALERWDLHPLREAAPLIRACLATQAAASEHLIVVSDAGGVLLQLDGDPGVRSRAADAMNFTEGALWSEHGAGTNAIGTALAADHAVQIFATEHFNEVVQAWTCSAAPVHDPETGELLGVIDLTGLRENVHPDSLTLAMTAARAVEGHLRQRMQERHDRLRERFQEHLRGRSGRRALVAPTGKLIADHGGRWLGGRVELPPGGGEFVLPSGAPAVAEAVGDDEAFVVRDLSGASAPRRAPSDELRLLADEQAALRRLATAVARNASPSEIFRAVAEEIKPLLGADEAAVIRFEDDGTATVLAGAELNDFLAVAAVSHTGRSSRVDDRVASPIVVEGRVWGAMVVSSRRERLPADTEERMANFTDLVGIVIANAKSRAELTASRARAIAAADEARRRIQRDLHDGAQQTLLQAVMSLKVARQQLDEPAGPARELVEQALAQAESAAVELRELAHGILPGALAHGGLRAGIDALVARVPLPVSVEVTSERFDAALEATAYFIVAEALTNVIKHAEARRAEIAVAVDGPLLRLAVRDDGKGGAGRNGGLGLVGLRDRAAACDGELRVHSAHGKGTLVLATLPVERMRAA